MLSIWFISEASYVDFHLASHATFFCVISQSYWSVSSNLFLENPRQCGILGIAFPLAPPLTHHCALSEKLIMIRNFFFLLFFHFSFSINQTVTGILACVQTTLPSGKIGFFLKGGVGGGICTQATGIWGFKGKWADILNAQDFFDIRELTDWKSSERPYYYKHVYSFPFIKMS